MLIKRYPAGVDPLREAIDTPNA